MKLTFCFLCLVALLGVHSETITADDVIRIGFLRAEAPDMRLDYFRNGMRALGYVEGRNLIIEQRWASGNFDELPRLARDLVNLKVDVIVTASTPAAAAASRATKTIPIVIAASADPVASGLVASLGHPGGNITGLTLMVDELSTKRLELLRELVPNVKRVAVLWSANNPVYARMISEMEKTASGLGVKLEAVKVHRPSELDAALKAITARKADGLYVFEDPIFLSQAKKIVGFAAKERLPAIYGAAEFVGYGGLVSYAPSHEHFFERAAWFVDRILKGAKPGDLPIEQPTKFEFVVNLKTAKALGLTIPQSILLRADEVIR